MSNQKRQSRGLPVGGQFAASEKDESGVSLSTEPEVKRHVWSDDPDKAKPPKAAVALVKDAEDAGMKTTVVHDKNNVEVAVEDGANSVSVVWTKGDYYDEPHRGKLPFRTTTHGATTGVRFNYANGRIRGEYPTIRSTRMARLYIGLPEK